MRKRTVIVCVAAACVAHCGAQGTFQNFNFEAAKIVFVGLSSYDVATSNALPGWTAFSGTNQLATVPYNIFTLVPSVGLYGSNSYVISGSFSVSLSFAASAISQTGVLPADAKSVLFKGSWGPGLNVPPAVSIDGQILAYVAVSNAPAFTLYGADVSAYAGQIATLTFTSLAGGHDLFLDDIEFSPQAVPEPTWVGVLGAPALLLVARRTRRGSVVSG